MISFLFLAGIWLQAAPETLLGPPVGNCPVVVRAEFLLQNINSINDEEETFEFAGILSLTCKDSRQAFDPEAAGIEEKIYQGNYQFKCRSSASPDCRDVHPVLAARHHTLIQTSIPPTP